LPGLPHLPHPGTPHPRVPIPPKKKKEIQELVKEIRGINKKLQYFEGGFISEEGIKVGRAASSGVERRRVELERLGFCRTASPPCGIREANRSVMMWMDGPDADACRTGSGTSTKESLLASGSVTAPPPSQLLPRVSAAYIPSVLLSPKPSFQAFPRKRSRQAAVLAELPMPLPWWMVVHGPQPADTSSALTIEKSTKLAQKEADELAEMIGEMARRLAK
jgi:hypothetical protein